MASLFGNPRLEKSSLGERALSVPYQRFEVVRIHILDGAGAGAIQKWRAHTLAGINECTNLLFDDIRTLTPEHDIQRSDRQARDQERGTKRESDDRRYLPPDEPPSPLESSAGSRPTRGPRDDGATVGGVFRRELWPFRPSALATYDRLTPESVCPKVPG